jgi:hypothetical protein
MPIVGEIEDFVSVRAPPWLARAYRRVYYFLQCLVAVCVTRNTVQKVAISALAAVLLFITLFAVPAG